jgi:hypothetical protein
MFKKEDFPVPLRPISPHLIFLFFEPFQVIWNCSCKFLNLCLFHLFYCFLMVFFLAYL